MGHGQMRVKRVSGSIPEDPILKRKGDSNVNSDSDTSQAFQMRAVLGSRDCKGEDTWNARPSQMRVMRRLRAHNAGRKRGVCSPPCGT